MRRSFVAAKENSRDTRTVQNIIDISINGTGLLLASNVESNKKSTFK